MNEKETYFYNKGKHDGYIEGTAFGNKLISEWISKTTTPQVFIPITDMKSSDLIKLLQEIKK
jgi:hypothetical protein